MKITRVSFLCCQYPLAKPISLSCGVLSSRNFGLVKIETDSGIEGWGETSINFPPWTFKERKATIEDGLAALLINENPLEIGRLWNKMLLGCPQFHSNVVGRCAASGHRRFGYGIVGHRRKRIRAAGECSNGRPVQGSG